VGLGFFPLMAAIDSMLPLDLKTRKMKRRGWAFVPIWLSTLLGPATYLMLAWSVAHHDLTGWQMFGGVMSCAWLSVVPMVPASHE
ncbi:alkane 1-monooxygenase, partial [Burkholderia sp. SIMBA_019]